VLCSQATLTTKHSATFNNVEYQIGNVPLSGTISYPDTSKQDVYGSWPPNPTKFTTELKDGYTIKCTNSACGGTNVRVKQVFNDQHLYIDPRFTTSFAEKAFSINTGPRGVGLVSGTSGNTRLEGSDPCKTTASPPEPCYENTRFLTELRMNDKIQVNMNLTGALVNHVVASIQDNSHLALSTHLASSLNTKSKFKIKTFHAAAFTYARKANGGLNYHTCAHCKTVLGYNSSTFTKDLMSGYSIIAKITTGLSTPTPPHCSTLCRHL